MTTWYSEGHQPITGEGGDIVLLLVESNQQKDKRIAELEAQLAAQREQIERLLAEAAHS